MSKHQVETLKPFISVLILMSLLFGIAFIKMENRRLGYSFMNLASQEKELRNKQRQKVVELAKKTGPERVQLIATQQLPLRKAKDGQVIQMSGEGVAFLQ